VKKIIPDIERYVIKNGLDESKERFGVEISKFKLIDIEIPKDQIEKQIENAAKMSAQVASDAREKLDTDALIEQAKIIQQEAEKKSEVLTLKEAIDIVQTQRRLIQNTKITGGKPVVLASSKKP
jgi:aspartyl/asparaginyl-tRNA synthetase